MKKVFFAINLFFILGLPFSSQAVQSVMVQNEKCYVENFPKKQKKLNFFQRIILKKIKRKIDRQVRKRNKQKENKTNRHANLSFFLAC